MSSETFPRRVGKALYVDETLMLEFRRRPDDYICARVTCPKRAAGTFHLTYFYPDENGNLIPQDDDVELTPYEMCLMYHFWQEISSETPS
jgi:hypothetical protein